MKRVLLGVTGGIAVYKAAELLRLLKKQGMDVRVVMTQAATEFVTPLTFQALSNHAVHTDLLNAEAENAMGHIELARWAEVLLIAPATANTLAKLAHGFADDLLTTLALAVTCPIYVAPAMNSVMWHNPATQANLATLIARNVQLIAPESGQLACGELGVGRMVEPVSICQQLLSKDDEYLKGVRVLISAGATREPIDPVRYLTNRSSGKMGYALAEAAVKAGATVTLVSGITQLTAPQGVSLSVVETAAEMYQAVMAKAVACDMYIGAAAVADYRPIPQPEKIKKHAEQLTLVLEKNKDILASVAALTPRPFTVGFAAETHDLENYALGKLRAKHLDLIAANWVGKSEGGFDKDENALQVFWHNGQLSFDMMSKTQLAEQLLKVCAEKFYEKNSI